MTAREFPEIAMTVNGGGIKAFRIVCVSCNAADCFQSVKGGKHLPQIAAIQNWTRKGWQVGSNIRKDFCPACARSARKEKPVADNVIERKADPPRQMSREDRRIVMEKLDDVYSNDKVGYRSPWTDERVAVDLGVPRAWVAEVRDQFFGEAISNPLLDEFLTAEKAFAADLKMFMGVAAEVKRKAADVETWREALMKRADEMHLMAKRIDKELGR